MLRNVARLEYFAVVERTHYRFPFDEYPGVGKVPVSLLDDLTGKNRATEARFQPVAAPLVRIARRVRGLRELRHRGVRGRREDIVLVAAGPHVLDEVALEDQGPAVMPGRNVEPADGIEKRELRCELRVGDHLLAGGREGLGRRHNGVLYGGVTQRKQAASGALRVLQRGSGQRKGDGVRVVIVIKAGVGAELQPVRELPDAR